jgi:hypothetical protein
LPAFLKALIEDQFIKSKTRAHALATATQSDNFFDSDQSHTFLSSP